MSPVLAIYTVEHEVDYEGADLIAVTMSEIEAKEHRARKRLGELYATHVRVRRWLPGLDGEMIEDTSWQKYQEKK